MIFCSIIRAHDTRRTTVYRRVRRSANVEFGELVELNVNLILRTPLALRLYFLGLELIRIKNSQQMSLFQLVISILTCSSSFGEPPFASIRFAKLRADEKFLFVNASFIAAMRVS